MFLWSGDDGLHPRVEDELRPGDRPGARLRPVRLLGGRRRHVPPWSPDMSGRVVAERGDVAIGNGVTQRHAPARPPASATSWRPTAACWWRSRRPRTRCRRSTCRSAARRARRRGPDAGQAAAGPAAGLSAAATRSSAPRRPNRLIGTALRRPDHGFAGNDRIDGRGGDDCVNGLSGDDVLYGGHGRRHARGRPRRTTSVSGQAPAAGHPARRHGQRRAVTGGAGNDIVQGNTGATGSPAAAAPTASPAVPGATASSPGSGRDSVEAGSGNDVIHAKDGQADSIDCGRGRDRVAGRDRADKLTSCERR